MVETVLLPCKKGPLAVQGVVIQEKKYGFHGEYNKILILDLMKMGFAVLVGQFAQELVCHFSMI